MGSRLGIIAGSGGIPSFVLTEAQKKGYECAVAGIRGEAQASLRGPSVVFQWFDLAQVSDIISFLRSQGVEQAILAGKIGHHRIFDLNSGKGHLAELLRQAGDRSPSALITMALQFFAKQGIEVIDPTPFLADTFCEEGILTSVKPSAEAEEDISFGWEKVRNLADLDLGQTVIVKNKAVVAVEGMEGTDEVIKRGGELAGEGTVGVKVSRSRQDPRIDLPAIGLHTVESLVRAGSLAFCLEAGRIPFFQREEAVLLAESHGISIVARKS